MNLVQYYITMLHSWVFKSQYVRYPLANRFSTRITDKTIEGSILELLIFARNKYPIRSLRVKELHELVTWSDYYKNMTRMEVQRFDKRHMKMVVKSDLTFPIIVASNGNGEIVKILDGFHRIKKAYILKKEFLTGYVVPENDLLTF